MNTPFIGQHATMHYHSDLRPYEVIEVHNDRKIVVRAMHTRNKTANGMSEIVPEFFPDERAPTLEMTLRKGNFWVQSGISTRQAGRRLSLGEAQVYTDPSS